MIEKSYAKLYSNNQLAIFFSRKCSSGSGLIIPCLSVQQYIGLNKQFLKEVHGFSFTTTDSTTVLLFRTHVRSAVFL